MNSKSTLTEENKKMIIKTLKENTELWSKILLFQKVELKENQGR